MPGYGESLWKYRIQNSDAQKGRSGGYRLLIHFNESTKALTPVAIYTHDQYPGQPEKKEIEKWIVRAISVFD